MELVGAVKDDFPLWKYEIFFVAAYLYLPFVDIDNFPKVMGLAVEYEIFIKFVVVDGNDLWNVNNAGQICFDINCFHIYPRQK